ncbi:MAG: type II restriction endonuclease [Chloroflexota bacterium]
MGTLVKSIKYWDYFVAWNKIKDSVKPYEIDLNTINYLVGKQEIEKEFKILISSHPTVVRILPLLIACRENNFSILAEFSTTGPQYDNFTFDLKSTLTPTEIDNICTFAKNTGLLDIFKNRNIKSVPDYVFGVEVGLDSNARKNRSGTAMENIVKSLIIKACAEAGYEFLPQAKPKQLKAKWDITVKFDKASRDFDFAVNCNGTLYLIETNYYGGNGSKLKATAGEYKKLHDSLIEQGHRFIWITDGLGWEASRNPLEDAFNHIDHILNLNMVNQGILQYILEHS